MRVGRRIFRDLWLDHRSTGLELLVVVFKTAFHIFSK
jgi:hypothetical protein